MDLKGCEGISNGHITVSSTLIQWKNAGDVDAYKLEPWCRGVGPPVYIRQDNSPQRSSCSDEIAVISWNVMAGGGNLNRFIMDLKRGRFTGGEPAGCFIILVQEAYRSGPAVPSTVPLDTRTGKPIRPVPPGGDRTDIEQISRMHGLNLFYVPAIRNGRSGNKILPEDRGNAVLASIPLESPTAIELPLERQRRTAVMVSISIKVDSGTQRTVRIINVHLENRAAWFRFFRSFGKARLNQIRALLEVVQPEAYSIMAGDFNTWFGGVNESTVRYVENYFRRLDSGIESRRLDHMFIRPPEGWKTDYRIIKDRYGSDHNPLLVLIIFSS